MAHYEKRTGSPSHQAAAMGFSQGLSFTVVKAVFREWWELIFSLQDYSKDLQEVSKTEEFQLSVVAQQRLLFEVHRATGFPVTILKKTVIMAMEKVLGDNDRNPTEDQINQVLELVVAFSAAAQQKINRNLLEQPN
jgi:hypothetical protein